ncbi:monovalent cation/H+ antiporter subunit D [Hydrogenophilus islandicus]
MSVEPLLMHLPVLLVAGPLVWGVLLLLLSPPTSEEPQGSNHPDPSWKRLRRLSFMGGVVTLLLALVLFMQSDGGAITAYPLGDWPPPFGIVLVADRLAALFVLLTAVVALAALAFALGSWDHRGRLFHPLFHIQWAGLNGAFLTGDIFNLFVFFEVLLIASYALLTHGLGSARLRAGFGYVVVNLTASALFLLGLALTYGAYGSLNLSDLALRTPELTPEQLLLARAGAALLLIVFAVKAAAAPLALWLPAAYSAASPPVAALFAIMTKVGLYAIIRVHWAVWGGPAGSLVASHFSLLLPAAVATALLGVTGALAARTLTRQVAYLTIASVGTTLLGVAVATSKGIAAALFYLVQSTITVALLFLLVALIAAQRGSVGDTIQPAPALKDPVALGVVMLFAAASAIGIPPFPGFLGKLYLLEASLDAPATPVIWTTLLAVGALTLVALARAGVTIFWHVQPQQITVWPAGASRTLLRPVVALVAVVFAMTLWAEPLYRFTYAAALQAADPSAYAEVVLDAAQRDAPWVRPYDGTVGKREEAR